MEIARRSKDVTSVVTMDAGTVFKYAYEYWMTTSTVDRITGNYVMCVNLHTGELRSFPVRYCMRILYRNQIINRIRGVRF